MNAKAVSQAVAKARFRLVPMCALAIVGLMSAALTSSALAASAVGKDGQVHACYRVKGKAKGAMRVVPASKKCRRGERKLAWNVAGPAGQQGAGGAQGPQGSSGSTGAPGANGAPGSNGAAGPGVASLETQVASLTLQVGILENVLDGVENSELTGALAILDGLNNEGLTKAVAAVPALNSLCTQTSLLTGGLNSLNSGIGGLTILGLPGLSLGISSLPAALSPYTCPVH
jgi:hypothetical protein